VGALVAAALAIAALASGPRALAPDALVGRLSSAGSTFAGWNVAGAEVTDANFATIERMAHWEAAVRMWSARPWLGQGPGHYELAYERFRLPRWSDPLGHAHNYYLHALAESGLIGLVAYLALLVALVCFAVNMAVRVETDGMALGTALGLVGALAAIAVHSVVDNVYVHDMTLTLGLMTGLAAAARATGEPQADRPTDSRRGHR
jgi:O-antigen ligase